jgi:serine/threonine protein kinase
LADDPHAPRVAQQVESLLREQARRWEAGDRCTVESLLADIPTIRSDPSAILDLVCHERALRERAGEQPRLDDYVARFPEFAAQLILQFQIDRFIGSGSLPTGDSPSDDTGPYASGNNPTDHRATSRVVAGRYEIGQELARGGMGVVYRATDRAFRRDVAVKVLNPRLVGTPAADRFFDEARITGQLQHPGIPSVHEVGTLPDGTPFLAMKLIRGRTLDDKLASRHSNVEEADQFLQVFEQVCLAVAFAHSKGVVHRDLKPQNVMVGGFGEVQVMDWGLAKQIGERDESRTSDALARRFGEETQAGTVLGTLSYMPPEQARGEQDKVDQRSDVFGLGAILCVILTGKPPYTGASADEVMRKAQTGDQADLKTRLNMSVKRPLLADLCYRCLNPDPARRPAHAGEVAVVVTRIREGQGELDRLTRTREEVDRYVARIEALERSRRAARHYYRAGLLALVVAALATAVAVVHNVHQTRRFQRATQSLVDAATGITDGAAAKQAAEAIVIDADKLHDADQSIAFAVAAGCYELANEPDHAQGYWGRAVGSYVRAERPPTHSLAECGLAVRIIERYVVDDAQPPPPVVRLMLRRAVSVIDHSMAEPGVEYLYGKAIVKKLRTARQL